MPDDSRIFLGLGSNISDRYKNLKNGIEMLNNHPHIWVIDQSHVYQSAPLYHKNQEDFYNMVIEIDTNLIPVDLLTQIKKIEKKAGRDSKSKKNMSRILDIDILTIGDLQIHSKLLEIPHPGIAERKFVLKPWNDIAPKFRLPEISLTIADLLDYTKDESEVRMVLILDKED